MRFTANVGDGHRGDIDMRKSWTIVSITAIAMAFVVTLTTSVTAQEFLPYEGKNAVREGEGGTKKVVDGIDFWADGAPPRPIKLLGYISDRRHKTGLLGMVRMSSLESDIAAVAKKNGGDAVVLIAVEAETVGTVGSNYGSAQGSANTVGSNTTMRGSGWSTGMSAAVQKQQSKYAVVKYVEREKVSETSAGKPANDDTQLPTGEAPPAPPAQPSTN